jgi:hypothetical protein
MNKLVPLIAVSTVVVVVAACRNDSQTPTPTTPTASAGQYPPGQYPPGQYPPGQYPPGQYPPGQYPPATAQPTGYPATAQPTAYPTAQPTAQPTMAPTSTAAPMGTQGILPCSSDAQCGLAHCNTQIGKCVYPCQNAAVDCIQGAQCVMGACVPTLPGAPAH